jgi:hypothetical protein
MLVDNVNYLSPIINKMPILGFEKHQYREKLRDTINKSPDYHSVSDETTFLIGGYFAEMEFPLHCRRTLDQFTYHMLKDTEERDNTQVMFKWAKEQDRVKRKHDQPKRGGPEVESQAPQPRAENEYPENEHPENEYPILMVDQLWLWVLEDAETVVTCFPNTWESNSAFNVRRHLVDHITKSDNRQAITSAMDLANEIIRCSVDSLRRSGPKDLSLHECFQSSISAIVSAEHP